MALRCFPFQNNGCPVRMKMNPSPWGCVSTPLWTWHTLHSACTSVVIAQNKLARMAIFSKLTCECKCSLFYFDDKMQPTVWLHFAVYRSWRQRKKTFHPAYLEGNWAAGGGGGIVINVRLQKCQLMPCRTLAQLLVSGEASNHKDLLI